MTRKRAEGTSLWHRSGALRWTVYLLVPLACLWVTADAIYRHKVDRQFQAIRDAGDPVTMSEVAPAPVPDDQNAAILYQQVFRLRYGPEHPGSSSLLALTGHTQLIKWQFVRYGVNAAEARAVLTDPGIVSLLETLERASMRPDCVFPVRWSDGPPPVLSYTHAFECAAQWLAAKARQCTMDGETDEGLRWVAVILRMANHMLREPSLRAQFVAYRVQRTGLEELERTLSETTGSAQTVQEVLGCLQQTDIAAGLSRALRAQPAMGVDVYTQGRRDPLGGAWPEFRDWREPRFIYHHRSGVFRPVYNAGWGHYLEWMRDVVDRAGQVPARRVPSWPCRRYLPFGISFRLPKPRQACYPPDELEGRDIAIMENSVGRVALALTLYRIECGRYPTSLRALQAATDWVLPQDFFASSPLGEPLRYERHENGFVLGVSPSAPPHSFTPDGQKCPRVHLSWECPAPPLPPPPPPPPASGGTGMGFL